MRYTVSIKKKGTFKYVINKGKYGTADHIVVYLLKTNKKSNSIGICVSKQNGNSVARNKLKRWVREVYKLEETKLKKGLTLVVLYKKKAKIQELDYHIVKQEIRNCFSKLDIYEVEACY